MVKLDIKTILIAAAILGGLYYLYKQGKLAFLLPEHFGAEVPAPAKFGYAGPKDLVDLKDSNAFGTVKDGCGRWEDLSLRAEYKKDPGNIHICKCGPPSKRTVDMYGSHHQLEHICAKCDGETEPIQLGNWWTRQGCGDPSSAGLNIVPYCTRCGN